MSPTENVRKLIAQGDRKNALKIASNFRHGITTMDRKFLKTGYECMVHPDIYRQMGIKVEDAIEFAWNLLRNHPMVTGVKA